MDSRWTVSLETWRLSPVLFHLLAFLVEASLHVWFLLVCIRSSSLPTNPTPHSPSSNRVCVFIHTSRIIHILDSIAIIIHWVYIFIISKFKKNHRWRAEQSLLFKTVFILRKWLQQAIVGLNSDRTSPNSILHCHAKQEGTHKTVRPFHWKVCIGVKKKEEETFPVVIWKVLFHLFAL